MNRETIISVLFGTFVGMTITLAACRYFVWKWMGVGPTAGSITNPAKWVVGHLGALLLLTGLLVSQVGATGKPAGVGYAVVYQPGQGPSAAQTIYYDGANLGIGTTSPAYPLDVKGHVNLDNVLFTATAESRNWSASLVDSVGEVGEFTSLQAIDANTLLISYYDLTNNDVKLARSDDGGLNWTFSTVDAAGEVGWFTSLEAVNANAVYVAYYDIGNGDLKFAQSEDGGSTWSAATIDAAGDVGWYSSLHAVDANTFFIGYYDVTNADLKLARSLDGGLTWTFFVVNATGDVGHAVSLDALDANQVYVSYQDLSSGQLEFAKTLDGGFNWSVSFIDTVGYDVIGTSLDVVDSNTYYIGYFDGDAGDLKFARSTNGGMDWITTPIDSNGSPEQPSLYALNANMVYISYFNNGPFDLKFAYSNNAGATWTSSTIEANGWVGSGGALYALDADTIYVSYADFTNNDWKLKLAGSGPVNLVPAVGVGTAAPGVTFQVGEVGDGTETRANAWTTFSDARWKTNLRPLADPLAKVLALDGYYFQWRNDPDGRWQVGVLAQDVEAVLPEIVTEDAAGYKSVDYSKLVPLLIEAIQAQQRQIEALETMMCQEQ